MEMCRSIGREVVEVKVEVVLESGGVADVSEALVSTRPLLSGFR